MNNKYNNFLTIILILIIVAIVGIIGFLGYKYYETYVIKNNSEDFVDTFIGDTENNINKPNNNTNVTQPEDENIFQGVEEGELNGGSNLNSNNKPKFNGFVTSGTIEIPAIRILSKSIRDSSSRNIWTRIK